MHDVNAEADNHGGSLDFLQGPARLSAHLDVHILTDATLLLWDGGERVLEEASFAHIVPLLDGKRDAADLIRELAGVVPPQEVLRALILLQEEGHLRAGPVPSRQAASAFWEAHGIGGEEPPCSTSVLDLSGCGAAEMVERAVVDSGLELAPDGGGDSRVVLVQQYLDPALHEVNEKAQGPWLLAKAIGPEMWLGPLFVPGETACWTCLAHRLERNLVGVSLAQAAGHGVRSSPLTVEPAVGTVFTGLVTTMLRRWALEPDGHPLLDTIVTLSAADLRVEHHHLSRRPQCPTCGDPTARAPQPIVLRSGFRRGSGGHVDDGDAFVAKWQRHISPITGIVPDLEPVANGGPAHLYRARVIPRPTRQLASLHAFRRNNAAGKGTSAAQARASALGEAFERYAMWWDAGLSTVHSAWNDLDPETTVHPNDMMLYSEAQLDAGPTPPDAPLREKVPVRFDGSKSAEWLPVWSLTHNAWRLVPAGLVFMGRADNHATAHLVGDSNGNACGGTIEDAVAAGLFELIERDSVAQWWYNRLRCPAVDLDGVDDRYVEALREEQLAMGREFWVLDVSADLSVPVFVSLTRRKSDGGGLVYGLGSHVDARIGILRAVTEMSQCMPSALRQYQRLDRIVDSPKMSSSQAVRPSGDYLLPDPTVLHRSLGDYSERDDTDISDSLDGLIDELRARQLEMLVVDLTSPDVGAPVVKVIVPGMRLHWRRLAPGRLYDVPVRLGRLHATTPEADVNPADLEI